MRNWYGKKDNRGYSKNFIIMTDDDTPKNISGYTIRVHAWDENNTLIISGNATITTATSGACSYLVKSGDFTLVGKYDFELQLTKGGELIDTQTRVLEIGKSVP